MPFESVGNVSSIDKITSDFDTTHVKVKKLKTLVDRGEYNADVARYILGALKLSFQGMLDDIKTVEQVTHPSYRDKEAFDFQLLLDKNPYTNLDSLFFVFTLRIRKATDATAQTEANMMTENNFFVHWIKEIGITKYGTMKQLISTSTP